MMRQQMREAQIKLMRGLLDFVILQLLSTGSMHGYHIINNIRRNFGVWFGPSTIYPLLNLLEEKGYVKSQWDLGNGRPRKVYKITPQGSDLLNYTEESLNQIQRKITNGFDKIPFDNDHPNTLLSKGLQRKSEFKEM